MGVHVGDAGTKIRYTIVNNGVAEDVSGATVMELIVVNADGIRRTLAGSLLNDGTDGIIDFTSEDDTWTAEGTSNEQVSLVLPSWTGRTKIVKRQIAQKLE